MSSKPDYPCLWNGQGTRGFALILNYDFKDAQKEVRRTGSKKDVEDLEKVLENLGYDVKVVENLTTKGTKWALDDFKKDCNDKPTTDSAIVVVMSHGMAGDDWTGSKFFTEDYGQIGTQEVVDRLQKISGLKGKPKICFFNMCRATAVDEESGPPEAKKLRTEYEETPQQQEDTFIVYSTLPRYPSYRFETGSVFIQKLCNKLADRRQVEQKDLDCLLREIVEDMRNERIKVKDSEDAERQIPEILNRAFTRHFYFFSLHKLRMHYLDLVCKVAPLPWYHDRNWSVDEIYTELVINGRDREPFGVEELFTHAEDRFKNGGCYRIIIEGDPGYGKSTLMLKMASDWSKQSPSRNYMNQFRYCFLVRLGRIGEDEDMEKFFVAYFQDMLDADMNTLLKREKGHQTLIILDGFDEANSKTKEFVCKVMLCERWNQCHVVLTSRFGYVNAGVKNYAMRTLLRGFHKKQVAVAVGKFFIKAGQITKDEAVSRSLEQTTLEDFCFVEEGSLEEGVKRIDPDHFGKFVQNLTQEDPYKDLARCPLLCAMMCCLMEDDPERDLPKTLAGLYFAVINRNLCRAVARREAKRNEDAKIWNWDALQYKFHKDHEKYLFDCGSLCLDYIQGKSSAFRLYEIVGNEEEAEPKDPKVTRLLEAGVIIQNFEYGKETIYLPTHRTMAEFLAAYRLTKEENEENVTYQLLKLYVEQSSFSQIFTFGVDLKCGRIFAKAFHDIKLPIDVVERYRNKSLEDKKKLLSEMTTALPGTVKLPNLDIHHPTFVEKIFRANSSLRFLEFDYKESMLEFNATEFRTILFNLLYSSYSLEFRHVNIKILNPSQRDVRISPSLSWRSPKGLPSTVMDSYYIEVFDLLIQDVLRFNIRLNHLELLDTLLFYNTPLIQQLAPSLQKLSHSDVCPHSMSLNINGADAASWEFLKNLPSKCSLAELDLRVVIGSTDGGGYEQLDFVVNDLLPDRLTKLGLDLQVGWDDDDDEEEDEVDDDVEDENYESPLLRVKPLISKIMSSEKLTSLCLATHDTQRLNAEDLIDGILGSKLEELKLTHMRFKLKSDDLTRWASVTRCRLRRVHLSWVKVYIVDPSRFSWNNISFPLEELTLDNCHSLERLLESHGSPLHSLRVLTLEELNSTSVLDFITVLCENSGSTLKKFTMNSRDALNLTMEKLFLELFTHCQELETVRMRFSVESFYHNKAILKAAFLMLPNLQTLEFPHVIDEKEVEYIRKVFEAIADRARQWPGKEAANSTLTLSNFRMEWAVRAALFFRERKLNYKIKYIEHKTYEMWFPPTMVGHQPARRQQTNNDGPSLSLWDRFCKIT